MSAGVLGSSELLGLVVFVAIYVVAALITIVLAVYVYRNYWRDELSKAFTLLMISLTFWILGTIIVSFARFTLDPNIYILAKLFKFTGVMAAPVLFLLFALLYDGKYRWVTKPVIALLLVIPAVTFPILATTRSHGLFYDEFIVTTFGGMPAIYATLGPWWWVLAAYGYTLLAVGSAIVVVAGLKRWPYYRFETALVTVGVAISWTVNLAYVLLGWPHPAIDPTPVGFALTSLVFAAGIFSTRLMDIPLPGRIDVLDAIDDAIIVLDTEDRVADANRTAQELLGTDQVRGSSAEVVLPSGNARTSGDDPKLEDVVVDGQRRVFKRRELTIGGENVGWRVIVLTDMTDEIETRRQLENERRRLTVLNRVLRHDIRNGINVILGQLPELRREVDEERPLRVIEDRSEEILTMSQSARQVESVISVGGTSLEPVEVVTIVEGVTETIAREYPGVGLRTDLPEEAWVNSNGLLDSAIMNLVENAAEHNDADAPRVEVSVAKQSGHGMVEIRIADNGPGVPDRELSVFEQGQETPLEHSSGLGLWLAQWVIDDVRGDIRFADNQPRGTVVTVRLESAPSPNHPPSG